MLTQSQLKQITETLHAPRPHGYASRIAVIQKLVDDATKHLLYAVPIQTDGQEVPYTHSGPLINSPLHSFYELRHQETNEPIGRIRLLDEHLPAPQAIAPLLEDVIDTYKNTVIPFHQGYLNGDITTLFFTRDNDLSGTRHYHEHVKKDVFYNFMPGTFNKKDYQQSA